MFKYELEINDKKFINTLESDFEYDKLDYLLDIAPIFHLYKIGLSHIDEEKDNSLSDYAQIAYLGTSILRILQWVSNYSDELFSQSISFYNNRNQISTLTIFSDFLQDMLQDFSEKSVNNFLNNMKQIDFNIFTQNTISNNIYAIIGYIHVINQQKNFNISILDNLKTFVEEKFFHIFVYLNKTIVYSYLISINAILKCNCSPKQIYQLTISSVNSTRGILKRIEDTCEYALSEIIKALSTKPYHGNLINLKDLISKYCDLTNSDELKSFRKNEHRCCAIMEDNKDLYFSFSGCKDAADSNGKISNQDMQNFITEINNNLFNGKAKYCYFTGSVKRYIDEIDTGYILLPSSIEYKDEQKDKGLYSCCERKILGLYPNLTQFNLFVFFSPCNRCLPALYQQYSKIHSFITYKKPVNYISVTDFSPKNYEIVLQKGVFLCKQINP